MNFFRKLTNLKLLNCGTHLFHINALYKYTEIANNVIKKKKISQCCRMKTNDLP